MAYATFLSPGRMPHATVRILLKFPFSFLILQKTVEPFDDEVIALHTSVLNLFGLWFGFTIECVTSSRVT